MRKTFVITFLILLSVVLISGSAYAIVGVCSNCHTMHNSQNGQGEVQTYAGGTITTGVTTPQDNLLKASCIACHAGSTGMTNSFGAPIVLHTTNPGPNLQGRGYTLAGGDFYWVATGLGATNSKGHNVAGIAPQEASPMNAPPGFDSSATAGFAFGQVGSTWASSQLTCAGTYGCHGQHTATGIGGAHHGNTGGTATRAGETGAPTTVGSSFRFLGGIRGLENSEWNWNETATVHNEYFGADRSSETYDPKTTISFSCAECHGNFHLDVAGASFGTPWLRHPTDIDLPTGEYAYYNTDGLPSGSVAVAGNTDYSIEAPVARTTVPATSTINVDPSTNTDDIVMCLSCHRAHGSPEPDILRWTYSGMQAGSGTSDSGCFTCHTAKNAG